MKHWIVSWGLVTGDMARLLEVREKSAAPASSVASCTPASSSALHILYKLAPTTVFAAHLDTIASSVPFELRLSLVLGEFSVVLSSQSFLIVFIL